MLNRLTTFAFTRRDDPVHSWCVVAGLLAVGAVLALPVVLL